MRYVMMAGSDGYWYKVPETELPRLEAFRLIRTPSSKRAESADVEAQEAMPGGLDLPVLTEKTSPYRFLDRGLAAEEHAAVCDAARAFRGFLESNAF